MAQIRNKYDIQNSISGTRTMIDRSLPDFFAEKSDLNPVMGITLSILMHVVFALCLLIITTLQGLIFPLLPKPELPDTTIEFKLVQNQSKPPINKNTKIRSDRDSQAGGKHNPKLPVSEPKPSAPAAKKAVSKQKTQATPKVATKQPVKPIQKPVQKPIQKPVEQPQKVVSKPTPAKPSAAKPSVKPVVTPTMKPQGVVKPSAPKIATAPKSPFTVTAPSTQAPVGSTYKPAGVPSSGQNGQQGSQNSAPTPKFSSTSTSSGQGGKGPSGSYNSRGSYGGYGSGGNPSPGNPNGAPGIDAIREPNWGPYMRDLEQRIKRNWTPPKGDSSKRVVITFTIGRDGRLLSHRITKSSGVPLADRAAMSAIELTAPFRPLPPEFRGQSVPIEFTFDYNVLNSVMR